MENIQIATRVPKDIKEKATEIFQKQGLTLPTALKMFIYKTVNSIDDNYVELNTKIGKVKVPESKVKSFYNENGEPSIKQSEWDLDGDEIFDKLYNSEQE